MVARAWKHVTRREPCPACGRADWCKTAVEGHLAFCRRSPEGPLGPGLERRDKHGESYWLHRLTEGAEPSERLVPEVQTAHVAAAEPEVLDRVYRALLDRLPLEERHRADLVARGFTPEEIAAAGFRTLAVPGRKRLAEALARDFGEDVARGVPGLYVREEDARTWWSLAGAAGLLIPVRDLAGRVLGLRVRRDEAGEGGRYSWVSSASRGGPGPVTGVHVPPGPRGPEVRLTEGELKAALATARTGVVTLSVAGVGRWREALPTLEALAPARVLLAFDADSRTNPVVARALEGAARGLADAGHRVAAETWPEPHKGVDDALQAGAELELLEGAELAALLARVAGRGPEPEAGRGQVLPFAPRPAHQTAGNLALAPAPGLKGYDFHRSDPGQAEFVLAFSGDRLRHCPPLRHPWLVWSGTHWEPDRTNLVHQIAIDAAKQRLRDAVEVPDDDRRKTEIAFALSCHSAGKRKATVETASVLQRVNVLPEALDADPWVLNCTNGTLDLRSGKLRPHRREDFLTKLAPVAFDASAACPLWEKFLMRVMGGDPELISYLQRVAGYCLTGSTREEVFFVLHGRGRNGKGVFTDTLAAVLGELAEKVPADLLCDSRRNADAPSPHLAKLPGVRLVSSSEAEEGRRLGEAFVKEVTGGDPITAHAKFADPITFKPAFKLLFSTNHRPEIRGVDEGIWSRIHLVPWAVVIPQEERDKDLKTKLLAELPGVLAWAVRGCLEWQRVGLNPPAAVLAATQTYRQDSDALAAFLAERTTTEETLPPGALFVEAARVLHGDLWSSYQAWCRDSGETPMRSRDFSRALDERGFPSRKGAKNRTFRLGIRLLADDEGSPEGDAEGGLPRLPGLPILQKETELPSLVGQPENWVTQVTQVTHQEEGEPEEPGDPGWELLL